MSDFTGVIIGRNEKQRFIEIDSGGLYISDTEAISGEGVGNTINIDLELIDALVEAINLIKEQSK